MTVQQVAARLTKLLRIERKITHEILVSINQAEELKAYLELGFGSMFEWLTRGHGYSEPAANRRIHAAALLREVPEASEKVKDGSLNLTNLAKTSSAFRAFEKVTGDKITAEDKAKVLEKLENKTTAQTEQALMEMMPEIGKYGHQDRRKRVNEFTMQFIFNMDSEAVADLDWVKAYLSHVIYDGDTGKIFARLLKEFRQKHEGKATSATAKRRVKNERQAQASSHSKNGDEAKMSSDQSKQPDHSGRSGHSEHSSVKSASQTSIHKTDLREPDSPSSEIIFSPEDLEDLGDAMMKRLALERANYKCEFTNPETGQVCGSTYQVQADHIIPRALGGSNDIGNYRCLCRRHNLLEAERKLGKRRASAWRRSYVRSPGTTYLAF